MEAHNWKSNLENRTIQDKRVIENWQSRRKSSNGKKRVNLIIHAFGEKYSVNPLLSASVMVHS